MKKFLKNLNIALDFKCCRRKKKFDIEFTTLFNFIFKML